ncbi:MAG: hypothetical protein HPY82_09330 [Gammaproteobacteria bacterium]|nr:hypothetical protein [Gammaproteobacteria bacterium]
MEIAIEADIPTYSGGLGMLAGDMLRSAVDMAIPMVGVTLVSRCGYSHPSLSPEGQQTKASESPATRRINSISLSASSMARSLRLWNSCMQ